MAFGLKTQYTDAFMCHFQVCDSDTMLDPASSVEMVKVLEEDPMVGGVGGDVQVNKTEPASGTSDTVLKVLCLSN